jgi:hypothetical protein
VRSRPILDGPHSNFNVTSSHALPVLLSLQNAEHGRYDLGTVKLRREFIHVNNLADSGVFLDAQRGRRGVSSKSLSRRGSDD